MATAAVAAAQTAAANMCATIDANSSQATTANLNTVRTQKKIVYDVGFPNFRISLNTFQTGAVHSKNVSKRDLTVFAISNSNFL